MGAMAVWLGHIALAIVPVGILMNSGQVNVAQAGLMLTPHVHCVVLSVLW